MKTLSTVPVEKNTNQYYWKLSIIVFFVCSTAMAFSSYLTVFLQDIGMSVETIGIIYGFNTFISVLGSLFWGVISDKMGSVKRVLILCLIASIFMWGTIPLFGRIMLPVAIILIPLSAFFRVPPSAGLADNLALQIAEKHNIGFGSIRLWGTVGYVLLGFLLSAIVPFLGIDISFYIYVLLAAISVFCIVTFIKKGEEPKKHLGERRVTLRQMHIGRLFRNYYFMGYLIYLVSLFIPMNASSSFMPYLLKDIGVSTDKLALIVACKSILEVPVLSLTMRLRRRFSLPVLISAQGVIYFAQYLLYFSVRSLTGLIIISLLQGLAGGVELGCGVSYCYELAPDDLKSTAHMLLSTMGSVAGIIGNILGGYVIGFAGIRTLFLGSGAFVAIMSILFLASYPAGKKLFNVPIPKAAKKIS